MIAKGVDHMLEAVFSTLGDIITQLAAMLVSIFTAVVDIFYTAGATEADPGKLTIIGILALVSVGLSLVMWGFNFILKLLKFR